jgi:DNA-directed RNA polymerase sigma subunit (sigma70/sigma32)
MTVQQHNLQAKFCYALGKGLSTAACCVLSVECVYNGQEEQRLRVRTVMTEKTNQLETQIQSKLDLAKTRREQLEQEQLEKLRSHVSNYPLHIHHSQ